jgi:hypothetical protein
MLLDFCARDSRGFVNKQVRSIIFMNKIIPLVAAILIVIAVIAAYYLMVPVSADQACINSGGTVGTFLCCASSGDFPNTCVIGACGCSPENSHEVKVCDCPEGTCFDGMSCVAQV